jgi:hypothetical protein
LALLCNRFRRHGQIRDQLSFNERNHNPATASES